MEFNPRVLRIAGYPSAELNKRKKQIVDQGKELFDFGTGDPIEPTPEFIREAVGKNTPKISQYPTVKGIAKLREAAAGYVQRRFGAALDPETEILPCTGSKEAIYNFTFLFVGPETKRNVVIGPSPGYPVMERSSIIAGAEYYRFELNPSNNFLMELGSLPESLLEKTAVAWINYPHNPTGAECSLDYLKRQAEIARKYDFVLASDECYADMYFGKDLPPSALQTGLKNIAAFHSCSKRSGMTAYRTGFVAGDREILSKFSSFRDTLGVAQPIYTQHAAALAWSDDAHAAERREVFKRKREIFLEFFKKHNFEWVDSESTLYFWIKTPGGISGKDYALKLLEHGIIVSPGGFFSESSEFWFRVALVPSIDDCRKALKLWEGVL